MNGTPPGSEGRECPALRAGPRSTSLDLSTGSPPTDPMSAPPEAQPAFRPPIEVRGARQNNLKGFDLDIPRRSLTVVTGASGSGKSSLVMDTLFAEGQRRYVESLSSYAKQFLERMERPRVDSVENLPPAVAIERKNPTRSSRSTVGTASEVYDLLRLLWARIGRTHCPACDRRARRDTVSAIVDRVGAMEEGERIQVAFPWRGGPLSNEELSRNLVARGFMRVSADGREVDLGSLTREASDRLQLSEANELLVVVDRVVVRPGMEERLADSVATCYAEGDGRVVIVREEDSLRFSERFCCPDHPEVEFLEPTPRLFSFNSPYGSCPACTGFGAILSYASDLIVPDPTRSLAEGAVAPWEKPRYKKRRERLLDFAARRGVSTSAPWRELPQDFRKGVIDGCRGFVGVKPFLKSCERRRYKQHVRIFLRRYQRPRTCEACGGERLRGEALRIRVGGCTIGSACDLAIRDLPEWADVLELTGMESEIAAPILEKLRSRLDVLLAVGLGYLTLSRQTRTLSGGEAQRVHLANALGSTLFDTLYVLDEPTIGLHPRDCGKLLGLLARLRDIGNSVVVVEHDGQAIQAADHVIELGPGGGERGGEVVFEGPSADLVGQKTVTGRYLSGNTGAPRRVGRAAARWLKLRGARLHNLRGVDVSFPLGALTVVTGVSGSGKSTLVHDVLYRALEKELSGASTNSAHLGEPTGDYEALDGLGGLEGVVLVDQSPIGRTPRSNPATYTKAWDHVRRAFASLPEARERGYGMGHFSFNVVGGRCEECKGAGSVAVDMVFLANVHVPCEVCSGRRYGRRLLEVRLNGKNAHEVLMMTVDEAISFFGHHRRLGRILWQLQQVGLGYLRLGQSATTLSGGEAQRLKIAREFAGSVGRAGRKLYILDEPTTGLAGAEVSKLLAVLDRLVEAGNGVVVVEHHLEVIRFADWVVDMGPGAGDLGGKVVYQGPVAGLAAVAESATGRYLARSDHP